MTRIGFRSLVVMSILVGLSAVGCCQKQDKEILELKNSYNKLSAEKDQVNNDLAQTQAVNQDLQMQLVQKDSDLVAAKKALADEQAKDEQAKKVVPVKGSTAQGWQSTAAGDKIDVGSDVLFSPGRDTLTAAGMQRLDRIANDLKTTYASLPVRVYGYTDTDPIVKTRDLWKDNLDLSANRAMAVTRHLQARGIRADRIETVAMGQTRPVASNATKEGKQKNRRVEIVVIR